MILSDTLEKDLLNAVLENAGLLIVVLNNEGRILRFNKACENLSGYRADEIEGKFLWDTMLPAEDAETFRYQTFGSLKTNPHHLTNEYTNHWLARNGKRYLIQWSNTMLLNLNGDIEYMISSGTVITRRNEAPKAVEESVQRYRTLVENIPGVSYRCACDKHWTMDFISKEIETLSGYPSTDFINNKIRSYASIIHPDDKQMVEDVVLQGVNNKQHYTIEYRIVHATSKVHWVYEKGQGIFDKSGNLQWLDGVILDITERKQTEQNLRHSEARLLETQRLAQLGGWELDIINNQLYWTDETFRLFEIDKNKFGASYEAFLNAIHPDDRDMVNQCYTDSLITREPYEVVHRLKMTDGRIKYVRERCASYFDVDGKPVRSVGTVQDITELTLAELALKESEQNLKDAQHIAHMGYLDWNTSTNEITWSDETYNIFGVPRDFSPTLESTVSMVHPQDVEKLQQALGESISEKKKYNIDHRMVRPDGNIVHVHAEGKLFFNDDGEVCRMLGTVVDITEQKRAQEELQRSQSLYQSLVDSLPFNIYRIDLDGRVTFANRKLIDAFGVTADEIVGKTAYDFYSKELAQKYRRDDNAVISHNQVLHIVEENINPVTGQTHFVETIKLPVLDSQGKVDGVQGIFWDISERHRMEKELQEHRNNLEALIQQRTAELEISLAEKEVLLKEVHHRVKNNLAMVSAFLSLQIQQSSETITKKALVDSNNRIRTMSMVHKKLYQSTDLTSINMQSLIHELCDLVYTPATHRDIAVDIDVQDIHLDMEVAIPCAMIINELLSNALIHAFKVHSQGLITISITQEDTKTYILEFSDNGCGLPAGFEIESSQTLGLQLVNIFVQQLNGSMRLDKYSGTRFTIRFPYSTTRV